MWSLYIFVKVHVDDTVENGVAFSDIFSRRIFSRKNREYERKLNENKGFPVPKLQYKGSAHMGCEHTVGIGRGLALILPDYRSNLFKKKNVRPKPKKCSPLYDPKYKK